MAAPVLVIFFTRAIGKLTGNDIQLGSEEFDRAFTVRCEDRALASVSTIIDTIPDLVWQDHGGKPAAG